MPVADTRMPVLDFPAEANGELLGGSPLPPATPDDLGDKARRKLKKRQARLLKDAGRQPRGFERWRMITEVAGELRHVVDLVDHKARYALIILGALNAAVFFVLSRGHVIGTLPASARPWILGFLAVYAALTFVFVLYAIDCLRPRLLARVGPPGDHPTRGLLYWETIARYGLADYRRAWSEAHLDEINAEAVVIVHHLAHLLVEKYRALGRLYLGLVILAALAMITLAFYAGAALFA
ncbi:MAG: Pycsar system effector family protein [Gemmatimonadales bacterium]